MLVANSFLIVTYTLNGVFEGAGITWPILLGGLASYGVVEFPLLFIVYIWFPGQPDLLSEVRQQIAENRILRLLVSVFFNELLH